MATAWSDIITASLVQIDDVRLQEQLAVSPAQFYRRMAEIVNQAFPLLSRPPELFQHLKLGMVLPAFDDYEWESTEESTEGETVVETGLPGFDLCSVTQRIQQPNGTISLLPYGGAVYNAETGNVTFPVQSASGIGYDIDLYTDGEFPDLTETQMRLFALAIAVVWDERFSRNWLNMQMKIKDQSFETVNEANYMEKVTKRLHDNRISFNDELRWYEQRVAYANTVGKIARPITLV